MSCVDGLIHVGNHVLKLLAPTVNHCVLSCTLMLACIKPTVLLHLVTRDIVQVAHSFELCLKVNDSVLNNLWEAPRRFGEIVKM